MSYIPVPQGEPEVHITVKSDREVDQPPRVPTTPVARKVTLSPDDFTPDKALSVVLSTATLPPAIKYGQILMQNDKDKMFYAALVGVIVWSLFICCLTMSIFIIPPKKASGGGKETTTGYKLWQYFSILLTVINSVLAGMVINA